MRIASGLNFGTGAPPNIVTNGLVLWLDAANRISYPESGVTWGDLTSQRNDGTLTNGPTYITDNGGVIDFDGTDDFCNLGSPSNLNTPYVSYEVCFKLDSPNNSLGQRIYNRGNTATNVTIFGLNKNIRNQLVMIWTPEVGNSVNIVLNASPTSNWTHIVSTYDGTSMNAYVNGSLDTSSTLTSGSMRISNGIILEVARLLNNSVGTTYMDGKVGVVRVYDRALSAAEVLRNFTALRGRYGI